MKCLLTKPFSLFIILSLGIISGCQKTSLKFIPSNISTFDVYWKYDNLPRDALSPVITATENCLRYDYHRILIDTDPDHLTVKVKVGNPSENSTAVYNVSLNLFILEIPRQTPTEANPIKLHVRALMFSSSYIEWNEVKKVYNNEDDIYQIALEVRECLKQSIRQSI
ncbi:MAG: hypothetical protein V3R64_10010 [Sphingomonadales bacterium]